MTHHVLHAYYLDSVSKERSHQTVFNKNPNADFAYSEMTDFFCTYLNCAALNANEMIPSDVSIYSYTSMQEVVIAVHASVHTEALQFSIIDLLGKELKIGKESLQFKFEEKTNYVLLNLSSINPLNQIAFIRIQDDGNIFSLPLPVFRNN